MLQVSKFASDDLKLSNRLCNNCLSIKEITVVSGGTLMFCIKEEAFCLYFSQSSTLAVYTTNLQRTIWTCLLL